MPTPPEALEAPTPEAKIEKALKIAGEYAYIDGSHHKTWTIDQMVRALTGCPLVTETARDYQGKEYSYTAQGESEDYRHFIATDDEDDSPWDEGIAP
ncbi:hypothetical protein ABN028_19800 [Actinopolymorpha sp. B17G11]|uniref:hypothetical protein n=1 Tax=Actinopolymorpha sp. B17G11 TaxID=3160861 RepID=UPI0032E3C7B7